MAPVDREAAKVLMLWFCVLCAAPLFGSLPRAVVGVDDALDVDDSVSVDATLLSADDTLLSVDDALPVMVELDMLQGTEWW